MARSNTGAIAVAGFGVLGLAALGAVGRRNAANGGGGGSGGADIGEFPAGLSALRAVAADVLTVGMVPSNDWIVFLGAVAHHESGWNPAVYNGFENADVPTGVRRVMGTDGPGAVSNYNRNRALYQDCPWPESRYTFGSGGWYGLIPSIGLHEFRKSPYQCLDPWSIFMPYPSTIMAIGYARRSMARDSFKKDPTWLNLNRAWKAPSNMGSPQPASDKRFLKALRAMGVSEDWATQRVDSLGPWNSRQDSINVLALWLQDEGIA